MVIQLTSGELAILQQADAGRRAIRAVSSEDFRRDLALLLEMQLVVQSGEGLEITLIGRRLLKVAMQQPGTS
jgi:hypothetical protein